MSTIQTPASGLPSGINVQQTPSGPVLVGPDGVQYGLVSQLPVYFGPWAGRPAAGADGQRMVILHNGLVTRWVAISGRWVPDGRQIAARKLGFTTGLIQTGIQIIGQMSLPGGMLDGNNFVVKTTICRDSNTDAFSTATDVKLGTAGTPADASIASMNISSLFAAAGGSRSFGGEQYFRAVSSTLIERLGASNGSSAFGGTSTSIASPNAIAVSGLNAGGGNTPFFLSITTGMAAATATRPQTYTCLLEIEP